MTTYHAQDIRSVVSWKNIDIFGDVAYKHKPIKYNADKPGSPPHRGDKLGNDPSKKPGKGFEWRGRGKPEDGKGSWYNPETGERLYPDLKHPEGVDPHWDYHGPTFPSGSRLYLDGTWEPK